MYLTSPRSTRDSLFFLRSHSQTQQHTHNNNLLSSKNATPNTYYHSIKQISPNSSLPVVNESSDEDSTPISAQGPTPENFRNSEAVRIVSGSDNYNISKKGKSIEEKENSPDKMKPQHPPASVSPSTVLTMGNSLLDWTEMKREIDSEVGMLSSPLSTLCYQDMLDLLELMKKGGTHPNLVIGKAHPVKLHPRKLSNANGAAKLASPFPPFVKNWISSSSSTQNVQFVFIGADLVDWLLIHVKKTWGLRTRDQASKLAQVLCDYAHICCRDEVTFKFDEPFHDDETPYIFCSPQRYVLNSHDLIFYPADSFSLHPMTTTASSSPVSPNLIIPQLSPQPSPSCSPSPVSSELALSKHIESPATQRGISRSSSSPAMVPPPHSIPTSLMPDADAHRDKFPAEMQQMPNADRALHIVSQALSKLCTLTSLIGDSKGVDVFKKFPNESNEFINYIILLPFVNVSLMTTTQHITFWLNAHNLLYMHGMLCHPLFLSTDESQQLFPGSHHLRFLHSCQYLISGYFFSLLDIHHAILRVSLPHTLTPPPSSYPAAVPFPPSFTSPDPRRTFVRSLPVELASLVTFSLVHCYADSPSLMIVSDELLSTQILYMAQHYLKTQMSVTIVTPTSRPLSSSSKLSTLNSPLPTFHRSTINPATFLQVELPSLFSLYSPDFGASLTSLMTWVSSHHWDYVEKSRFADFAAARKVVLKVKVGIRILGKLHLAQQMTSLLDDEDEYGCADQYALY